MQRNYSLSIIVPVYNEIQLLKQSITSMDSYLQSQFEDYEILVIESGSTDGSDRACDSLADELPHVNVTHEGARNGFGSALKLGYKQAKKDLVWLVTVDLPFPLQTIEEALPLLETYDCVLSYRVSDERSRYRKILSFAYNGIIKASLGLRQRHINSAFKLFKREIIQGITLFSNGWFLDAEILYWLKEKNIRTIEIPILMTGRTAGESKVAPLTPVFMLWEMLKFLCSRTMKHD